VTEFYSILNAGNPEGLVYAMDPIKADLLEAQGSNFRAFMTRYGELIGVATAVVPGLSAGIKGGTNPIVLDLFGGRTSQIPGAINVDIIAEQGVRASASKLPFASGSVDQIIASNPYIPGGSGMMDFLPGVAETLKPGGQIIINATQRNPFGVLPSAQTLESLGLRVVQENGPLLPQFKNNVFRFTDGRIIPNNSVRTTILEKMK
jgi:filamentous hemagglutinin